MFFIFFIIALLATIVLLYHVTIELNELEKNVEKFADDLNKHYEIS